jgi:hypothetical protein
MTATFSPSAKATSLISDRCCITLGVRRGGRRE